MRLAGIFIEISFPIDHISGLWAMVFGDFVSQKHTGNIALQALNFKGYYKFFTSQKVPLTGLTCTFFDLVSYVFR